MHLLRVGNGPCKAIRFFLTTADYLQLNNIWWYTLPEPTCTVQFRLAREDSALLVLSSYCWNFGCPAVVSMQMLLHFHNSTISGETEGGHPGQGSWLCWTEATTYPIALLSGDGAALFLSTHIHTYIHTLGLWECRRPGAQTFPTARSALICYCKCDALIL